MAAYTNYRRDPRVRREAEALAAQGHRVSFLACRQDGEPDRENIAGVEVTKAPCRRKKPESFAAYLADYLLFFTHLAGHLTLHPLRYDLIHINNMPDFLVFAALVPKLLRRPVIHDVHDYMPHIYMEKKDVDENHRIIRALRAQFRRAVRFATAVVAANEAVKALVVKEDVPPEKVTVLLNLPDERIFKPRPQPAPKPDGAPFVVVYHGTLARRLGLDLAIQAVALLRDRIPNLQLKIVGAGEELPRLQALAGELNVEQMVEFSGGFLPLEDIPSILSDADAGLVPMRNNIGTRIMLPTKLLEYVHVGVPAIVLETDVIRQYFDAAMVRFFAEDTPEAIADAILDLYAHPEKRRQLVDNGEVFRRTYCWSEHQKVYIELVESLLKRRGRNAVAVKPSP